MKISLQLCIRLWTRLAEEQIYLLLPLRPRRQHSPAKGQGWGTEIKWLHLNLLVSWLWHWLQKRAVFHIFSIWLQLMFVSDRTSWWKTKVSSSMDKFFLDRQNLFSSISPTPRNTNKCWREHTYFLWRSDIIRSLSQLSGRWWNINTPVQVILD